MSVAPIVIVCNMAWITATGVMRESVGERWANLVFHDLAGWLMMPLALGLLGCELWLLSVVLVDDKPARPAFRFVEAVLAPGVPPGAVPGRA